jgi:hypothetical protein
VTTTKPGILSVRKLKPRFAPEITAVSSGSRLVLVILIVVFGIETLAVLVFFQVITGFIVFRVRIVGLVVHGVVAVGGGGTGDLVVEALEVGLVVLVLRTCSQVVVNKVPQSFNRA